MRSRRAGRVIVRDPDRAVLLARASEDGHAWWFTPGGGTEGRETPREAAIREVFEETGIDVSLDAPPVLHRRARFNFLGALTEQVETFWLVDLDHRPLVVSRHLEAYEAEAIDSWHWWPSVELADLVARDDVFPRCLPTLLSHLDQDDGPGPWVEEHLADVPTLARSDVPGDLPGWTRS